MLERVRALVSPEKKPQGESKALGQIDNSCTAKPLDPCSSVTIAQETRDNDKSTARSSIFENEDVSLRVEDDSDWPGLRQELDQILSLQVLRLSP